MIRRALAKRLRDSVGLMVAQLERMSRGRQASSKQAVVMVNGPCDLSCAWCNIAGTRTILPGDELTRVTRELEQLADRGTQEVCFGLLHTEPTTVPELPEILRRARGLGFRRLVLSTSGMNLADPVYLERLVPALDAVIVTVLTLDRARSDRLFGRPKATDQKLRAIRNCMRLGLDIHLPMMFLRPVLHDVPQAVTELRAMGEGYAGTFGLHGCLMDYVHGAARDRYQLLWPTYPEVQWTLHHVARVAPSFRLMSTDMPLCVRARIPGVDSDYRTPTKGFVHPDAICGQCPERKRCGGIPEAYVERLDPKARTLLSDHAGAEPPRWSVEELDTSLRACEEVCEQASTRWTTVVADGLAAMDRRADWLDGFRIASLEQGPDRLVIRLQRASEALHFFVEPTLKVGKCFLKGDRFALSYESDTPIDSAWKVDVAKALLRAVHECATVDP